MPYKPYSIASPPFEATSGGIRVMWALQGWLQAKGQIALMNTQYDVPFVGIYPEIYHGNELGADTVVRYILNKPGTMAAHGIPGPTQFDPNDKIYVFSKIFDTFGVDEDHLLFLPVLNLHLFKDLKKKRTKTCYLVGKGENTHQHPEDAIEITRMFASDQMALAELLSECQMFYCYDPVTAMMEISRLCGCPVRYFGNKTKKELMEYEPGIDGIDFGEGYTFRPERFRYEYQQLVKLFSDKLDILIDQTQGDSHV